MLDEYRGVLSAPYELIPEQAYIENLLVVSFQPQT